MCLRIAPWPGAIASIQSRLGASGSYLLVTCRTGTRRYFSCLDIRLAHRCIDRQITRSICLGLFIGYLYLPYTAQTFAPISFAPTGIVYFFLPAVVPTTAFFDKEHSDILHNFTPLSGFLFLPAHYAGLLVYTALRFVRLSRRIK